MVSPQALLRLFCFAALWSALASGARATPEAPLQAPNPAAACLEAGPPDDAYMRAWIATRFDGSARRTLSVRGVRFVDQPVGLLREYMRLVPAGDADARSACTTVECALEERFGRGVGLRLMFMLLRYGLNGAASGRPEAQPWTSGQLDDVLLALSDLPPHLLPDRPVRLVLEPEGAATDAEAIALDPRWGSLSPGSRRAALFTAVAAHFERRLDQRPAFRATWKAALGETLPQPKLLHLAAYMPEIATKIASELPVGAALYRYAPLSLMQEEPRLYALLREAVFDGLEYRSDDQCGPERSLSRMAERVARAKLGRAIMNETNRALVAEQCGVPPENGVPDAACTTRALYRAYLLKARLRLATFAPEVVMAAFGGETSTNRLARTAMAAQETAALKP